MERPAAKLLDRVRYRIRLKGYSIHTEQPYVSCIRRFATAKTGSILKMCEKTRSRLTLLI